MSEEECFPPLVPSSFSERWECWKKPSPTTPLFDFVEFLIDKPRAPRIKREWRRDLGIQCPYAFALDELFTAKIAVVTLHQKAQNIFKDRPELRQKIQQIHEDLDIALKAIQRSFDALELEDLDLPPFPSADSEDHVSRMGDLDELGGMIAMARTYVLQGLRQTSLLRLSTSKKRANFERRAFVAHIGRLYRDLTGRLPAAGSGPFPDFVEAAFVTAFPYDDTSDWNEHTRNIDWETLLKPSEW